MNTLTGIEAERVDQILQHAIEKLRVLSYVPTIWDNQILEEIETEAIAKTLDKHWTIEEQLKSIHEFGTTEGGKDLSVMKQAHRSTRALVRNLQADRPSLQVLMSRPELQSEEFTKFYMYLNDLRLQVHDRLTTTVEDEIANKEKLHDLTERERDLEEKKEAIQKKLDEVRDLRESDTLILGAQLKKLQLELNDIKQHNAVELEGVQKDKDEAIAKATSDHELRMRELQEKLESLERSTSESIDRHKEEEMRLRREKTRAEKELATRITQYDEDMDLRRVKLNELRSDLERETAEYEVLREYFEKVDTDIHYNQSEDRVLDAVRRREEFGMWVLDQAAVMIQKHLKGRWQREAYKKILAKKNKKGKGKKGKGKKK